MRPVGVQPQRLVPVQHGDQPVRKKALAKDAHLSEAGVVVPPADGDSVAPDRDVDEAEALQYAGRGRGELEVPSVHAGEGPVDVLVQDMDGMVVTCSAVI